MEIVSHNGMMFLSPVADRESIQINSYMKWEQAFRIYSNILTSKFPGMATELLQYNHTIHSASTTYIWENVYSYDKEFSHHISRHPYRSWAVILQQAWTMLLKDRHRSDGNHFQRGGFNANGTHGNRNKKEPCRRFNKGNAWPDCHANMTSTALIKTVVNLDMELTFVTLESPEKIKKRKEDK